jgi:hypothetical protein
MYDRLGRPAALLLAAFILGACAHSAPTSTRASVRTPAVAAPSPLNANTQTQAAREAATSKARAAGTSETRGAVIVTPAAPVRPRFSARETDPKRLLRLGQDELAVLLGQPGFVRREAAALVWQYRTQSCVLDVFLYRGGEHYSVTDFEFRAPDTGKTSSPGCLEALLLRRITASNQS